MCSPRKDFTKFSHNIYKNNPILFKSYIGKEAIITTDNENVYTGIVYTVDPVSESIVLLNTEEDDHHNLQIIFGHAIQNVELTTKAETQISELFQTSADHFSPSDLTKKKNLVKQHLLKNMFPVRDVNDILYIENSVSINPPYNPENCVCTNSIILNRIQNILCSVEK